MSGTVVAVGNWSGDNTSDWNIGDVIWKDGGTETPLDVASVVTVPSSLLAIGVILTILLTIQSM